MGRMKDVWMDQQQQEIEDDFEHANKAAHKRVRTPTTYIRWRAQQKEKQRQEKIVSMADERYYAEGRIEIDPGATVSEGEDNGAYVQAWVWVDFSGTSLDKGKE